MNGGTRVGMVRGSALSRAPRRRHVGVRGASRPGTSVRSVRSAPMQNALLPCDVRSCVAGAPRLRARLQNECVVPRIVNHGHSACDRGCRKCRVTRESFSSSSPRLRPIQRIPILSKNPHPIRLPERPCASRSGLPAPPRAAPLGRASGHTAHAKRGGADHRGAVRERNARLELGLGPPRTTPAYHPASLAPTSAHSSSWASTSAKCARTSSSARDGSLRFVRFVTVRVTH